MFPVGKSIESHESVSVYQYLDFRKYLSDAFAYFKKTEKMTLRAFADKAGFSSHAFLKRVIDGERSLSLNSVRKISRGFRLNKAESLYFSDLVSFDQAETIEEQNELFESLMRRMPKENRAQISRNQYQVFNHWYIMAIRELVGHPEFQEDPAWIARQLYPPISRKEAADALEVLIKNKFLIRDDNNKLKQSVPTLTTGDRVASLAVKNYHKSLLEIAVRNMMMTGEKWRDISSLSFLLQQHQFQYIKKRTQEFRKEILEYLEQTDPGTPSSDDINQPNLYFLNMQLFHTTRNVWEEES